MIRLSKKEVKYLTKIVNWDVVRLWIKPGLIDWLKKMNEKGEPFDPAEEDLLIGTYKIM